MKLPDDPKERKKLYLAMVFGACALLYGVYAGVITPVRNSKAATEESIEELKQQVHTAELLIERVDKLRGPDRKVAHQIVDTAIHTPDFIVPALGNYLLPARKIVDACAERSELALEACTEVGLSEIPQHAGRKTKNALRSYTVRVALSSGVYPLLAFIRELETDNPFVCVHAISIAGRPGSPEKHLVALDILWATWADASVRQEFLAAVEDETAKEEQTE